MNKTCTFEQAKRLKELGVEQVASEWFTENGHSEYYDVTDPKGDLSPFNSENDVAAFNTDELLVMIPHSTAVSIMPITDQLTQSRLFCAWLHNMPLPYISGKTPSSVLTELIISANENKVPGFTVAEINERIKQYNAK